MRFLSLVSRLCLGPLLLLTLLPAVQAQASAHTKSGGAGTAHGFNAPQSFTVTAWVKLQTPAGTQVFVSRPGLSAFSLSVTQGDNRFAFALARFGGGPSVRSGFTPTPGLWYHLAGVYDRPSGQIRLYVNGVLLGMAPESAKPMPAATHNPASADEPILTGPGADTVRLYPHALSSAEVADREATERRSREPEFTWANPLYFQGNGKGDDIHDPQILADRGVYYLVATLSPFRNYTDRDPKLPDLGSAPGISLYASRDLKVWKFQRWLLKSSNLPEDSAYKHQFWAPEIHKLGRRYYLIFGGSNWISDKYNSGGRMGYFQFVGVADRVGGPYSHFTLLKGPGVDTSLFEDSDGKTYVIWPGNEIHPVDLSQIDQDRVTIGPVLSRAAGPDDYKALGKPAPGTMEGPYLIKRGGTYYCFFAATYPDLYATDIASSKSLAGPWTLDPRTHTFPCGHQAEFVGPGGRWWMAYKRERSDTTPWLSVDPIAFDAAGRVQIRPTLGPQHL